MTIARREFLKVVGGASVASSLATYSTASLGAVSDSLAFGFTDENVPMNAANLCPMPSNVTTAHARYAQALDLSLSSASRATIVGFKEEARSRVAAMLGTSPDEIAIVRNTSEANNVIVQGVPLQAGDEVVLWDQNHPSNSVAWDVQAKREGASVRRFSVPTDTNSIDEVVDLFVAAVSDKTTVISFTHISNITGFRTPATEICAAIRKRKADIFIHVDGAQTWGAVDIDLAQSRLILSAAVHTNGSWGRARLASSMFGNSTSIAFGRISSASLGAKRWMAHLQVHENSMRLASATMQPLRRSAMLPHCMKR